MTTTTTTEKTKVETRCRFSDILADDCVRERWKKVRAFFFLRESTYDMTCRCNIRCNGCYYYEGDKQHSIDNRDGETWQRLMSSERERGITFVVLAGAEPALVPDLLAVCYEQMPLGAIATNGLRLIPPDIGYRLHISVWGNDETSLRTRSAPDMLEKQIRNYHGDPRAVFVYTFTRHNIDEAEAVVDRMAAADCRITFNMFSAPVGYQDGLRHTPASLEQTRRMMLKLQRKHTRQVLSSPYSAVAHTHRLGLHALYGCAYPRRNPSRAIGLGRSFRQYRSDLTWDRKAACCVPDTDCDDCRHYAAGSAVVTARMFRHAAAPQTFKAWLDYVDTYLAVWVNGYQKSENLCDDPVAPPGQSLF